MKKILVTGGLGYIGSEICCLLQKRDYDVVILDKTEKTMNHVFGQSIKHNLTESIDQINGIDAIIHLASFISVEESEKNPIKYWKNNIQCTINVLDFVLKNNVRNILYSSSAAVYSSKDSALLETDSLSPSSTYGKTKLECENIIRDVCAKTNINYCILRYFNACGQNRENNIIETHEPETHIIPILVNKIETNSVFNIFGKDYNTLDGTCVRDYVDIKDLGSAHIAVLEKMCKSEIHSETYNVGTGKGLSILQVIDALEMITNKKVKIEYKERRQGDPAFLVASPLKIEKEVGWRAKVSIQESISSYLCENND